MNRSTINAYRDTFSNIGSTMDIWDLSYYSILDLANNLNSGSSLLEDFRGKTVIFPQQRITTKSSEAATEEMLIKRDFYNAAVDYGINFIFLGSVKELDFMRYMMVPSIASSTQEFDSQRKLVQSLRENQNEIRSFDQISVVESGGRFFLWSSRPSRKNIDRQAKRLQSKIDKRFPDKRYYVVTEFAPEQISKGLLGIGKKWSYGNLSIRRSLDIRTGSGVLLDVGRNDANDSDFIQSDEFKLSLFVAMPFSRKLDLLTQYFNGEIELPNYESLVRSFYYDIANEQASIRKKHLWKLRSYGVRDELAFLNAFTRTPVKLTFDPGDIRSQRMISIFANLEYIVQSQLSIWDKLLVFRNNSDVTAHSKDIIDRGIRQVFNFRSSLLAWFPIFNNGQSYKEIRRAIATIKDGLWEKWENYSDKNFREEALRKYLVPHIVSGSQVTLDPSERLLNQNSFDYVWQLDQDRDSNQERQSRLNEVYGNDLKVD